MGIGKYIKTAFLNKWNLLAFGAGVVVSALSGPAMPIVLPLILAGEIAYLGFVGTHPKFQKYVEAQEAKANRAQGTVSAELTMRRILGSLPPRLIKRFEDLRSRCRDLQQLAQEIRDPQNVGGAAPLEQLQVAGLDRLLWIYLRLLFTQYSLERFMEKTSEEQIQRDVKGLERRISAIPSDTTDVQQLKLRKSLEDNLETSKARLANFAKARDNYELLQVEIERLENKIRSLSELAVNRQEPDFIAGQVDQVVGGMVQTERTMSELQFVTGLEAADEQIPQMMRREAVQVKQ